MKATATYTKEKDEKGILINYFVKDVEKGSELEKILIGLDYIYMGWNGYKVIVRTPAELDAKRNPILSFL